MRSGVGQNDLNRVQSPRMGNCKTCFRYIDTKWKFCSLDCERIVSKEKYAVTAKNAIAKAYRLKLNGHNFFDALNKELKRKLPRHKWCYWVQFNIPLLVIKGKDFYPLDPMTGPNHQVVLEACHKLNQNLGLSTVEASAIWRSAWKGGTSERLSQVEWYKDVRKGARSPYWFGNESSNHETGTE